LIIAFNVTINVIGDFPWTRPHWSKIEKYIESSAISPNGKRIAVAGEIFYYYSC
jgi:hypothetical protein